MLLLLFPMVLLAQKSEHIVDNYNKVLLKYIMEKPVENVAVKNLLSEKAQDILKTTKDTNVIKMTNNYIKELNQMDFTNSKNVDLNKTSEIYLKNFRVNTDKFSKITYITHKKNDSYPRINIYIAIYDKAAYLRLTTEYYGKDWIFMNKVTLIIDGKTYDFNVKKTKRDVSSSATVNETSDQIVTKDLMEIINALNNTNNNVDIRFEGNENVQDYVMNNKYLYTLKETITLFNSLQE